MSAQHIRHTKTPFEKKYEKAHRNRRVSAGFVVLIIVVISVLAGVFAFKYMTDSRITRSNSNALSALEKADSDTSPTYTLLKLDYDTFASVPDMYRNLNNTRTYCLLRIDTVSKKASICTIPANISCEDENGDSRPLCALEESGGDFSLISAVNGLFDVKINHFVALDGSGIETLVDTLGGLDVTLESAVDDPYSGNSVMPAGGAKRFGAEILGLLRVRNITDYYTVMPEVINDSVINAMSKLAKMSSSDFNSVLNSISNNIFSDSKSDDLYKNLSKFGDFDFNGVSKLVIAGSEQTTTQTSEHVFLTRTSEFIQMLSLFKEGNNPEDSDMMALTKSPESVTVEVRNGAGIAGAASKMSEIIKNKGYNVEKSGNAEEGYVYSETLIVYMDEEFESCAYDIKNALSCGRVIFGGDYYTSDQNIISIVGADWAAAS